MNPKPLIAVIGSVLSIIAATATLHRTGYWPVTANQMSTHLEQFVAVKSTACDYCMSDCLQWCPEKVNPPEGCDRFCRHEVCSNQCE